MLASFLFVSLSKTSNVAKDYKTAVIPVQSDASLWKVLEG